jgi:hypothetical protein
MKTSELTGAALDWVVAKAEGFIDDPDSWLYHAKSTGINNYHPSTDWAQGGPIIEREGIDVIKNGGAWASLKTATANHPHIRAHGPTPLIAAMRGYVASKLGDEIEVPREIK